MEQAKTYWQDNIKYKDVREFHFESPEVSFIAFFKNDNLIFVIDSTYDIISPNQLLIIEPLSTEPVPSNPQIKWDAILKEKFKINPLDIRPKQNTKYKKLDISYISLDIYNGFISTMNEELFDLIKQSRQTMGLENAYQREAESLLIYNKSSATLKTAQTSLEASKKKILNISKKLRNQESKEISNPLLIDDELKASFIQKLYLATEKLKRTERRIKRASKRFDLAIKELADKREQIRIIKEMISQKNEKFKQIENERLVFEPVNITSVPFKNILNNQDVTDDKNKSEIEQLTIYNNNDKNRVEEEKGNPISIKESDTMVKDTDNKVKTTAEFKPPFVDDTVNGSQESDSGIRFAKKSNTLLDDKYKKIWTYSLSIIASLVIVFGIFYFISGDETPNINEDVYNNTYIEQSYNPTQQVPEEIPYNPQAMEDSMTQPEYVAPPAFEQNSYIERVEAKPAAKKTEYNKKTTTYTKPVVKKSTSAKHLETKRKPMAQSSAVTGTEEVIYEEEYEEEYEYVEPTTLEDFRTIYVESVIDGDYYASVINNVKKAFFDTSAPRDSIKELEEMNADWNKFRNVTYDTYYELDNTLKSDINYEQYANDEYLLRLYSNAYFELYEYLVNEFVMTYEYANSTATELYNSMEAEMQLLGRPSTKLMILEEAYNAVVNAGGPAQVLTSIAIRDEQESMMPDAETGFIPLSSNTEMVVNEDISYEDGEVSTVSSETDIEEIYEDDLMVDSDELTTDETEITNENMVEYEEEVLSSDEESIMTTEITIAPINTIDAPVEIMAPQETNEEIVYEEISDEEYTEGEGDEYYEDDEEYTGSDEYYEEGEIVL